MLIWYDHGRYIIFLYWYAKKQWWEYGIIHKYTSFTITDNTPSFKSTISGSWNQNRSIEGCSKLKSSVDMTSVKIRMVAIPRDKFNYHKVSKYANVVIFKEFYPKTKKHVVCSINQPLFCQIHFPMPKLILVGCDCGTFLSVLLPGTKNMCQKESLTWSSTVIYR